MNDAVGNGAVDNWHCGLIGAGCCRVFAACDSSYHFFDRGTHSRTLASITLPMNLCLPGSFFGLRCICHLLDNLKLVVKKT